ncbi:hypothetical protein VULLAG_LOCUS19478 [Vulpes lagopus]
MRRASEGSRSTEEASDSAGPPGRLPGGSDMWTQSWGSRSRTCLVSCCMARGGGFLPGETAASRLAGQSLQTHRCLRATGDRVVLPNADRHLNAAERHQIPKLPRTVAGFLNLGPRNRSSAGVTRVTIMGVSVARSAWPAPLSLLYQSAREHFALLPDTRGRALSGPQFLPLHNKDDVLHGLRGPQVLASTCRGRAGIAEPGKAPLGGSPAAVSSSAPRP